MYSEAWLSSEGTTAGKPIQEGRELAAAAETARGGAGCGLSSSQGRLPYLPHYLGEVPGRGRRKVGEGEGERTGGREEEEEEEGKREQETRLDAP